MSIGLHLERRRVRGKRWILVPVLIAVLLLAFLILRSSNRVTTNAVTMTVVGYTNVPGNDLRFALFSVSNQAPYAVRWRGSWVEVEGKPEHKAETINPKLPGFTRQMSLKAGETFKIAIGEPSDTTDSERWRFAMAYVPYDWRQRWLDFSRRHNVPLSLRSIVFVDAQRSSNPSNNVTVTTAWITMKTAHNQKATQNDASSATGAKQ